MALEPQLEAGRRLTVAAVREVTRERTARAIAELPLGLFEEHDMTWQVTVRGHVTAALCAIPPNGATMHFAVRSVTRWACSTASQNRTRRRGWRRRALYLE
ncbi:MAG: hypothetical protein JO243_14240 [Solirubrobacterales bacterium]|nr:hypothetical protein [Solirubrobacterales bacterium]